MILLNPSCTLNTVYPVILLEGQVSNQRSSYISVTNHVSEHCICWPVISQTFRAFVLLRSGINKLTIKYEYYVKEIVCSFKLRASPYTVQPLYIVCKDGDGRFQAPPGKDNSCTEALKRISLGAALLQTFTAYDLKLQKLGNNITFNLPIDSNTGLPECNVFESQYTAEEMYAMTSKDLWRSLAKEIMSSDDIKNKSNSKFLAFVSCTRYDGQNWNSSWKHRDIVASTCGHIALGGGGLAVLGSATLHTWADSLENLVSCFTDEKLIDRTVLMDDSAYRLTYWANFSTGLGAALHELGHTFDLPHSASGIMSRGFDNIHMFFVLPGSRPISQSTQPSADNFNDYRNKLKSLSDQLKEKRLKTVSQINDKTVCTHNLALVPNLSLALVPNLRVNINLSHEDTSHPSASQGKPRSRVKTASGDSAAFWCNGETHSIPVAAKKTGKDVKSKVSTWAFESALMLRYNRWFMNDNQVQKIDCSLNTLILTQSGVTSSCGMRVLQIFYKCLDQVVFSQHFSEKAALFSCNFTDFIAARLETEHSIICDRGGCVSLHILDDCGKFMNHTLS